MWWSCNIWRSTLFNFAIHFSFSFYSLCTSGIFRFYVYILHLCWKNPPQIAKIKWQLDMTLCNKLHSNINVTIYLQKMKTLPISMIYTWKSEKGHCRKQTCATYVKAHVFQAPNKGHLEAQYKRQYLLFEIWLNKLLLGKKIAKIANQVLKGRLRWQNYRNATLYDISFSEKKGGKCQYTEFLGDWGISVDICWYLTLKQLKKVLFYPLEAKSALSKILNFGVSWGCLEGVWGCLEGV